MALSDDPNRIPYRKTQPRESPPELLIADVIPADERIWVPLEPNVWFRPPLLCAASCGYWMNLLKVRKSGVLSRHRRPQPVHAYVLKGEWRYLEHDWIARQGSYAYEAPSETHTLVVDPDGVVTGFDDVFTRIDKCRARYAAKGLGADYVDRFVR